MRFLKGFLNFIPFFIALLPVLLIIALVILIIYLIKAKVKIKLKSFRGKGFRPVRGNFGLYTYCGKQGTGKTYSLVEYLVDNSKNIKVFSNITDIDNVEDITYFRGFKGLIQIKHDIDSGKIKTDKQIVIVFDEVFTELQKGSKIGQEVMDFLCQMRKRQIIFLTTCQEWAELPLTYRRFCRFQIDCNMRPFLWTGILIKTFKDAENMKWSNDEQEHVAPLVETTITKCRKFIADSYDTRLRISSVIVPTSTEKPETSPEEVGEDSQVSAVVTEQSEYKEQHVLDILK